MSKLSNPKDLLHKIDSLQKELANKTIEIELLKAKNTAVDIRDSNVINTTDNQILQDLQAYKLIVNSVTEAIYILNTNWEFVEVNRGAETMYGYSRDELIGKTPIDVAALDKNDIPKVVECLESVLKNGGTESFEFWGLRKNGDSFLKEVIVTQGHYKNEAVVIATSRDITERKNAELELLKFKSISDKAVHGNAIVDLDGAIIYCNNYFANIHGYTSSELEGKQLSIFHNEKQLHRVLEINKGLFENGSYELEEVWHTHKNGTEFPMLMNGVVIYDKEKEPLYLAATAIDITESKRVLNQLAHSEEKFRALYDNAPLSYQSLDEDGKFLDINPTWCDTLGYSRDEVIGENYANFLHPDWRPYFEKNFPAFKKRGYVNDVHFKLIHKKGHFIDVSFEGCIGYLPDGSFKQTYCVFKDITIEKRAQQELLESEAKFKGVFRHSNVGITISDNHGNLLESNKQFCEISGYAQEELFEMNFAELTYPDDNLPEMKLLEDIHKGLRNNYRIEKRIVTKKREIKWIDIAITVIRNEAGEVDIYIANVMDINSRKETETILRESEEKFRSIFDESPIGIEIYDGTGKLFNINKAALKMFGIRNVSVVEHFNLFDGTSLTSERIKQLKNGYSVEYTSDFDFDKIRELKQYETNAKGVATFDYRITPLKGTDETTIDTYLMQVLNITHRKKAEKELIKAKDKAEESDRLKSAFLANMSHEIRTPMNGILGFAELLEQANLPVEEQKEYVDIIKQSGARMLSTVNDIIDISKIDAKQVVLEKTEVNIKNEIDSLYLFFKPEAQKKGLELKLKSEFTSSDLVLETDKGKVISIFTNLIKNAIKYTDHGEIEVGINIKDDNFLCWVKDTGIGIPKNRQQAIFNRFEQADIDDFYAREGSGLGLAIAKSYAEMLGGTIYFESQQGVGSTFYFSHPWKPLIENNSNNVDANSLNLQMDNKQLKILIAEDDDISFAHLSIVLRKVANKIIRAKNGIEAVELAKDLDDIDCILLDVKMPLMDGYKACRKIRKFNSNVIIIAQTAYALENEREKAINAGCNDYISKPINRELLLEILAKQLH